MKRNIFTAFAVMVSLTVIIWSGCKKDNGPKIEEFIIKIDSMVHPDTINFGDTLIIKLYGMVGPDGCYAFDRLEGEFISNELFVTSWGIHTFNEDCTQAIVYMNGEEAGVTGLDIGTYILNAVQPDGSNISQNVYIKD